MRILILDTAYPAFLATVPFDTTSTYDAELRRVHEMHFGTSTYYSSHLSRLGWQCMDVMANFEPLQRMWAKEHNVTDRNIVYAQIREFQPHVIFLQDASFLGSGLLSELKSKYVLAAQISCPLPPERNTRMMDVIFSSLPGHVEHFKAMGVKSVFLPLAYQPSVLEPEHRDLDVSFVGGVGRNSHWNHGTHFLEQLASHLGQRFHWYGYGLDNLDKESPLRACYRGLAWGGEMYSIYARSRIVANRHGEIAGGYSNNLRMYESTGCGAMLLTEISKNLSDFFSRDECVAYESPEDAVEKVKYYLAHEEERAKIAAAGQRKTLSTHTYEKRMAVVSETLKGML